MDEEIRLRLVEDQQRYECEAVERGVRRYRDELRKSIAAGNEADTKPGTRMLLGVMTEIVPQIARFQDEAVEQVRTRQVTGSRATLWAVPILCLSAEKWGLIAARTALSFARQDRVGTQLALAIAGRAKEEREFEMFLEAKRAEQKSKKKAGEQVSTFMNRMLAEASNMRPRQAKAFMRKARAVDKLEWSLEQRTHVGILLVETLVAGGGGWFEMTLVTQAKGGRITTERRIRLTQAAQDFFTYHHAQSELTRPWMLPMLCPPNDWRIVT